MSTIPLTNPDPKLKAAEDRLREVMLALPEATEDFPWGHRAAKVKGKMFAILVLEDAGLTVTTKLPDSNEAALTLPFTAPTGYGMGKSGWVTSTFKVGDDVPVELLGQWVHESFRAVAPQRVLKAMGGAANVVSKPAAAKKALSKPAPVKKTPAKNVVAKSAAVKKTPAKKNVVAKSAATKKAAAKKVPAAATRRGTAAASRSKR
ncbi:MmcQ/YjbR family DNA-binding protein [Pyxidicoccus trucidator]|uniref:MmcQ/YjbR family DNA-binding protein n=1 Tax=Pyxidicoccus trucidator TaxID=2709662 RepID=UPI0013DB951E|nr:MmcQ/YjbR family DNA-binding protein [Pyxidicoccus trucidator]